MRNPDPVRQVKRSSSGGFLHAAAADADVPMITERRRKSRSRLPVDDVEESDGAQAEEGPLAGSRVRTGMANVDTRRRSGDTTSRAAAISDRGRRGLTAQHARLNAVEKLLYMLLYALFLVYPITTTLRTPRTHPFTGPDAVFNHFLTPFTPYLIA